MLIRISLVIAILAGLAAGALNFLKVKEKIETLATERNDWHGKFDKTDAELTTTKADLDKTSKDLKQTQDTLAATSKERDTAVAEADTQIKKATELAGEADHDDGRARYARAESRRLRGHRLQAGANLGFGQADRQDPESVGSDGGREENPRTRPHPQDGRT